MTGLPHSNGIAKSDSAIAALKRTPLYQALKSLKIAIDRTRSFQTLRHGWRLAVDSRYRLNDRKARDDFRRFCERDGGRGLRQDVRPLVKRKTVLVIRNVTLPYASVEAVVRKAFHMAGFETVVLGHRRYDFLRYDWLTGNQAVLELEDFGIRDDIEWVDGQMPTLNTMNDWLALEYQGVQVGRFVIALALRQYRGALEFQNPRVQQDLRGRLSLSVRYTIAASRMLREIKPDCVLLMDRGYSGQGEIFDLAIKQGIDTLTWNLGYKSNRLAFKRYHSGNERDHHLSPSAESWRQICAMPWDLESGNRVRKEIFDCYQTQDWFSLVGTQFDKQILSRESTRQKLGLTPDRKVAVIFPHILWDGSFFWGKDLFSDYKHWFVETIKAAVANPRLQWVVKLHPAHIVKAKQNGDAGRPLEFDVIEKAVGSLPDHVKLVHPDSELSTYSLFQIADYAVTVRGTVGIESGLFGIPVVTAGTGRYDRRGFTLDSATQEEYHQKLATLETFSPLSAEQIELAERYAYAVFLARPLALSSVSLEYARDGKATPRVRVRCQTRDEWLAAPDMQKLAAWVSDGKLEDMLEIPSMSTSVASPISLPTVDAVQLAG